MTGAEEQTEDQSWPDGSDSKHLKAFDNKNRQKSLMNRIFKTIDIAKDKFRQQMILKRHYPSKSIVSAVSCSPKSFRLFQEYPVFESFDDYELDENLLRSTAAWRW